MTGWWPGRCLISGVSLEREPEAVDGQVSDPFAAEDDLATAGTLVRCPVGSSSGIGSQRSSANNGSPSTVSTLGEVLLNGVCHRLAASLGSPARVIAGIEPAGDESMDYQ